MNLFTDSRVSVAEVPFLCCRGGSDGVTYARNLLSDSMSKYQSVESSQLSLSSTPTIKTSLQLVQPVAEYVRLLRADK